MIGLCMCHSFLSCCWLLMGLNMTFRGPEGVCVFLNALSEVQLSSNVYK